MSDELRMERWRIEPRDAWVFAREPRANDLHARGPELVPLPSTMAAAARAHLVGHRDDLDRAAARALLDVRVRGPWLLRGDTVRLPAPADLRVGRDGVVLRGALPTLAAGEGVWSDDDALREVRALEFREAKAERVRGFHPLDTVVSWMLGESPAVPETQALRDETRTHVRIDAQAQTAAPGLLFTTPGVRYPTGWALAVEVTFPTRYALPDRGLFMLGSEARVAMRRPDAHGFPPFSAVRARYAAAAEKRPRGLSLMLLTPGYFGSSPTAWVPAWLRAGEGSHPKHPCPLRLVGYEADRPLAITGWNMVTRASRAVRRAVPAGAVYRLTFDEATRDDPAKIVALCEALWGAAMDESMGPQPDELLAAPHHDGFGMAIPGLWE